MKLQAFRKMGSAVGLGLGLLSASLCLACSWHSAASFTPSGCVRSWQVWRSPSCIPPFEDFVTRNEPRAQRVASANAGRTSGLHFDAVGPAWLRSALGD